MLFLFFSSRIHLPFDFLSFAPFEGASVDAQQLRRFVEVN